MDVSGDLLWVNQIGGSDSDVGYSISSDAHGNIYITGFFSDTVDFDPGNGIATLIAEDGYDVFIQKLNSSGSFIWAKQMGGRYNDYGFSITIDDNSNVYTTGLFNDSVDFDPGAGISNLKTLGSYDIFIQKLDSNGNFQWVRQMGGVESDIGRSITTDLNGNIYTTGEFNDTVDFDPGVGVFKLISAGSDDIFIQKLDANGNFLWAKKTGGAEWDGGVSIDTDISGNIYTTGHFQGTVDFDPGVGTINYTATGFGDVYIQKFSSNGNLLWAAQMGGSGQDQGNSIMIDNKNNVFTTGFFIGSVDFDADTGITNLTSVGFFDIFIQKLSQTAPVGLKEASLSDNLVVYPNPTDGKVTIQFDNIQEEIIARLFSISGKEIMTQSFQNSTKIELEFNQPSGIYLLELIDEKGNKEVVKVLKK